MQFLDRVERKLEKIGQWVSLKKVVPRNGIQLRNC
jgi:hypothetical protein